MLERVARAIAEAFDEDFSADAERYMIRARHAVYAMKNPLPEVNSAIVRDQPKEYRVVMQLGYERGLDAVLGFG
ncbi:hypothetical protein ASF34_00975 [Methylobacterium sp. Leaf106]|nr:hypothetical protein ASF34_00975 [Methylobacterium sp. Leaf106]